MTQARYGGNSSYGRVSKNYDPTLERPTRFTRSDKQAMGAAAIGALGVGQIGGAIRMPGDAQEQLRQATTYASMKGNELQAHKAKIASLRRGGNRPVNMGIDRDRPGGPLKNWANRRRLNRQTPAMQERYMDAKNRVTAAKEAARPANIARRQRSLALTGAAVTAGGVMLGRQAWKNRKLEQEAGIK